MGKIVSGIKNLVGVRNALSEAKLFLAVYYELRKKYGKSFIRFYRYIKKIALHQSHNMTEYEEFEFINDALQTFATIMIEAEQRNIDIDPILLADLILFTRNNYERIREFFFAEMSEEERLLNYEKMIRKFLLKGFILGEIIENWEDISPRYLKTTNNKHLSHKQSRKQCEFAYINSVRIPEKLYEVLEMLKDETQTVSSYISNLLIKHKAHEINPEKVLEFNKTLQGKYPKLYKNKRNRTFSVMLPAYLRWLIYSRKVKTKKLNNKERGLIGLAGLLWYILLTKEFSIEL